jgi:alpha-glucosidase
MSCFMALFRSHAAVGTPLREPWQFGEPALSICREFLKVRRSLIPYLYSMAWAAHQKGAPMIRPLAWVDEDDHRLWEVEDAFMLGNALLVAPVVEQGGLSRKVVLPKGRWYSFWDDTVFDGGNEIIVETPLERIPVFVREGVVLPRQEEDHLVLHYYAQSADAGEATSVLYMDEGDGYNESRVDTFTARNLDDIVTLNWSRAGYYPLSERTRIVVHGASVARAWVDGIDEDWTAPYTEVRPFSRLRLEYG